MPTIVHFDISADDIVRAKKFYSELFHWKIEKFPGPTEYFLIETESLEGEKGVSGGIALRENPQQKITNFIAIPSIDEYIAKVEKLGGKIIEPKQVIPTIGYIAGCQDTEGNTFGLMEIDENAK
jgi:predicted enzyme related to lactoylglutathione lyase